MRVVVATTLDDPLSGVFWEAYYRAGGLPPAAVLFLLPRRRHALWGKVVEGLLLFGLVGSMRWWLLARRTREVLRRVPQQIFDGVKDFSRFGSLNGAEGLLALEREAPHLLVSVGSPEIFKPPVLRAAAIGAVNVHNGRLPAYRGLFGTFWEAFRGEDWGYTSIHVMETGIDSGPVLAQAAVRLTNRSLIDALVAKRYQGGKLLAWLVRFVEREGRFPPPCPYNADVPRGYYSWPSLREVALFGLKRLRNSVRRPARLDTPVDTWPVGMAIGDDWA